MPIDSLYCTQAEAEAELLSYETPITNVEPDELMLKVGEASRAIEDIAGYQFAPSLEVIELNSVGNHVDDEAGLLYLPVPFVDIRSLYVNLDYDGANGTLLTLDTDYTYEPAKALHTLALRRLGQNKYWGNTAYEDHSIRITGYVTYHPNYRRAWQPISALAANLDTTSLSLTVTSGHGARFSRGMLLRIGAGATAELFNVESIATDVITVPFRDDNNNTDTTTAQAHSSGATIYRYHPYKTAVWAASRTTGLYYKRRGDYKKTSFAGVSTDTYPSLQVADEVRDALRRIGDTRAAAV